MTWSGASSGEHFLASNPASLKNLSIYNAVTDYGADPTGAVDSTTAIQNAINAIPVAGGIVWFPTGNFVISNSLTVYASNIWLLGAGISGILGFSETSNVGALLKLANTVNKDMLVIGNTNVLNGAGVSVENVLIENLTLDGNKANNTSGRGIVGFSWAGGGVRECTIHNMASHGLQLNTAAAGGAAAGCCLDIRHNTIEFVNGNGIDENGNVYDWIVENHIEQTKGNGINAGSSKLHILYNNILQAGFNQGGPNPVVGNAAIALQGTEISCIGNYLENSSWDGIYAAGTDSTIVANVVDRVGVQDTGHSSGYAISGQRNLIANNIARDGGAPQKTNFGFEERTGSANNRLIGNDSQAMLGGTYFILASTSSKFWYNIGLTVANHQVTAGASPYTYTNNDGVPEVILITTVGGLSALTYKGQTGAAITAGIPFMLNPGEAMIFTWVTTAPVFQALPLTS